MIVIRQIEVIRTTTKHWIVMLQNIYNSIYLVANVSDALFLRNYTSGNKWAEVEGGGETRSVSGIRNVADGKVNPAGGRIRGATGASHRWTGN